CAGIDRIEPILLVDRLAPHDRPAAIAAREEIVEAAGANRVDDDAVDARALVDRHFRLRDRAVADDVARVGAQEVDDADAALESRAPRARELRRGALEPRRRHPAVIVPDG